MTEVMKLGQYKTLCAGPITAAEAEGVISDIPIDGMGTYLFIAEQGSMNPVQVLAKFVSAVAADDFAMIVTAFGEIERTHG